MNRSGARTVGMNICFCDRFVTVKSWKVGFGSLAPGHAWGHSSSGMLVGPFCGLGPANCRSGTPACDPNWFLDRQIWTLAYLYKYLGT